MYDEKLINFLLDHNTKRSEEFSSPDASLSRQLYKAKHPTNIIALMCMDGRLHLPIITKTPLGMIQPFRNIGGQFDLGWPFFGSLMKELISSSIANGDNCIILNTYHFSKSDPHLGCKGYGYDTELAIRETKKLKEQFERVFGSRHNVIYPILVGIETDEDTLILHGSKDEILDLSTILDIETEDLKQKVQSLYPDMKGRLIKDFLPLLVGNIQRIKEIREQKRPIIDISHRESILAVGRGFDWLHLYNKALIVGPFSYNLKDPIGKAAGILLDNLKQGRIEEDDGVVLMTSAVYSEASNIEYYLAKEKALSLAKFSLETIKEQVPELIPYISILTGTVDMNTRYFNRIPFDFE